MSTELKQVGDIMQWFTDATDADVTFRLHCTQNPPAFHAEIYYYNHAGSQGVLCNGEWKKTVEATVKSMLADAPRTEQAAIKLAEYVRRGRSR